MILHENGLLSYLTTQVIMFGSLILSKQVNMFGSLISSNSCTA